MPIDNTPRSIESEFSIYAAKLAVKQLSRDELEELLIDQLTKSADYADWSERFMKEHGILINKKIINNKGDVNIEIDYSEEMKMFRLVQKSKIKGQEKRKRITHRNHAEGKSKSR